LTSLLFFLSLTLLSKKNLYTNGWDNLTLSFEKNSIKFTRDMPRGYFIIKSGANLSTLPTKMPDLYFTFDGTNKLAYNPLANLTVSISAGTVTPPRYGANLTSTFSAPTPAPGKVSLSMGCSQKGFLYYVLSVGPLTATKDQIKAKTYDLGIAQTPLVESDPQWSLYGFKEITAENTALTFDVKPVRAGGKYNITWFCASLFNTSSAYTAY